MYSKLFRGSLIASSIAAVAAARQAGRMGFKEARLSARKSFSQRAFQRRAFLLCLYCSQFRFCPKSLGRLWKIVFTNPLSR
jgi:hypothetical protein